MLDHATTEELVNYKERRLTLADRLAVSRHLDECDLCYERFCELAGSYREELAAIAAAAEADDDDFHLSYDDYLEPYVDNTLNVAGRDSVESHIENCKVCDAELQALLYLKEPPKQSSPALASASVVLAGDRFAGKQPGKKPEPPAAIAPPRFFVWRRLAIAAAILLALAVGLLLYLRAYQKTGEMTKQPQVEQPDEPPPPNNATQQPDRQPPNAAVPAPDISKPPDEKAPLSPVVATLTDNGRTTAVDPALIYRDLQLPPELAAVRSTERTVRGPTRDGEKPPPEPLPSPLLSPVGIFVRQRDVTFRWQPVTGATGYKVIILDTEKKYREVARSPLQQATQWKHDGKLQRGVVYLWELQVYRNDATEKFPTTEQPKPLFKLIDEKALEAVQRVERTAPTSHLRRGLAYAKAGLLDDAEREFMALAKENPDSPMVKKLLEKVRLARKLQ